MQPAPAIPPDTDTIGGFPYDDPACKGCGKPLELKNAWMTDGCPCNTPLGINNLNETRWRLLMKLQQSQQFESGRVINELRQQVAALRKENERLKKLELHGDMWKELAYLKELRQHIARLVEAGKIIVEHKVCMCQDCKRSREDLRIAISAITGETAKEGGGSDQRKADNN